MDVVAGAAEPVVAGRVWRHGNRYDFGYGRSYLDRPDAISLYTGQRESSFAACLYSCPVYGLTKHDVRDIIDNQIDVIERDFSEVADLVRLAEAQRNLLWRRQILNPFARYGY